MNAKMQLMDIYVLDYCFNLNCKVVNCPGIDIDGSVNAEEIKREEIENGILVRWKQENNIIMKDDNNGELGKIKLTMIGEFLFDKSLNKEEIDQILLVNANAIMYQQARAFVSANTALTNSVPNIMIPIINFNIPSKDC